MAQEELSLTDRVIQEFEETGDDAELKAFANKLERKSHSSCKDAFKLYEKLNDSEGMERAAKRYLVEGLFLDQGEDLMRRAGKELTPQLYTERGDRHFKNSYHHAAFEAYQKAGNQEGMKKTAGKLEKDGRTNDAFECYVVLGDEESAYRMAKEKFIRTLFPEKGEKMFQRINTPITAELWNSRARYLLDQRNDLDGAFHAYQKAGNTEGSESVKQRALK